MIRISCDSSVCAIMSAIVLLLGLISPVLGEAVSYQYHAHNGIGGYSYKFSHPQKYSHAKYHHYIPEVHVPVDTAEVEHAKAVHVADHAHHQEPTPTPYQEPQQPPVYQQPSEEPRPSYEDWHGSQHNPMTQSYTPETTQKPQDDHAEFRNVAEEDQPSLSYEFDVFHSFKHAQEAQAPPTENMKSPSYESHESRSVPEEDQEPNYPEQYRYIPVPPNAFWQHNPQYVPVVQHSAAPVYPSNHNQPAQRHQQAGGQQETNVRTESHKHHQQTSSFEVWHVPASNPMVPAETPEVQKARAAHLAAHAEHQQYHHKYRSHHHSNPRYYLPEVTTVAPESETSLVQQPQAHQQYTYNSHSHHEGWQGHTDQTHSMNVNGMHQENDMLEAQHREVVDYNASTGGNHGPQDGGFYTMQWVHYQ